MIQELISKCPKIPAPLVSPIKMDTVKGSITRNREAIIEVLKIDKIKSLLTRNQVTITSILVLTPSMGVPAYFNYNHPIIGCFIGLLVMAGFTTSCIEQMVNAKQDPRHLKRTDDPE